MLQHWSSLVSTACSRSLRVGSSSSARAASSSWQGRELGGPGGRLGLGVLGLLLGVGVLSVGTEAEAFLDPVLSQCPEVGAACSNAGMMMSQAGRCLEATCSDGTSKVRVCVADGVACDAGVSPVCGDGCVAGSEDCDDANTVDGDECSADCKARTTPVLDCTSSSGSGSSTGSGGGQPVDGCKPRECSWLDCGTIDDFCGASVECEPCEGAIDLICDVDDALAVEYCEASASMGCLGLRDADVAACINRVTRELRWQEKDRLECVGYFRALYRCALDHPRACSVDGLLLDGPECNFASFAAYGCRGWPNYVSSEEPSCDMPALPGPEVLPGAVTRLQDPVEGESVCEGDAELVVAFCKEVEARGCSKGYLELRTEAECASFLHAVMVNEGKDAPALLPYLRAFLTCTTGKLECSPTGLLAGPQECAALYFAWQGSWVYDASQFGAPHSDPCGTLLSFDEAFVATTVTRPETDVVLASAVSCPNPGDRCDASGPEGTVRGYCVAAFCAEDGRPAGGVCLPAGPDCSEYVGTCGDGCVGMGESCDDGNNVSGDACDHHCEAPYRGIDIHCSAPDPGEPQMPCDPVPCGAEDCGTIDAGCGVTLDCGPCGEGGGSSSSDANSSSGEATGSGGVGGSGGRTEGGNAAPPSGDSGDGSGCSVDPGAGGRASRGSAVLVGLGLLLAFGRRRGAPPGHTRRSGGR